MKNIHVLTTGKPSRLLRGFEGIRLFEEEVSPDNEWCVNVNICITSDEEIKEGDPRINNYQRKLKGEEIPSKKIILTTDQDLIKDGVQAIDDEFLEWFVKNPSCEEVEVEWLGTYTYGIVGYKIIIQKQEPKQETLEEAAEKWLNKDGFNIYNHYDTRPSFIAGAKWQQERMYSEEETLEDIILEEVVGSKHCLYSIIENKLSVLYRNQEQILKAIKMLNHRR